MLRRLQPTNGPAVLKHGRHYVATPPKPAPGLVCTCYRCDAVQMTTGGEQKYRHFIQEYQHAVFVDAWAIPCPECGEINHFVSPYPEEEELPTYKTTAIYDFRKPKWKRLLALFGINL